MTLRLLYIQLPALIIAAVLICAPYVFADQSISENFMAHNTAINEFGGYSTTSSFTLIESGGEIQTGQSTSTNFMIQSGSEYYDDTPNTFASKNWRWYDDEINETPVDPLADENVS